MLNSESSYDLLVVGAGINGAGIARDAAGRGLRVLIVEKGDLASATSQWSTKLIHGGLRYLEQFEFRLVRDALAEREVVLHQAPHIVAPLMFVLPHEPHLRPAWMLRAGLFLYDHLGRRETLPGSFGVVDLASTPWGAGLKPNFHKGFVYSDARVDDARLVVFNVMDARDRGAEVRVRTRLVAAQREQTARGPSWRATLATPSGSREIEAKVIVNATGPWVKAVRESINDRMRHLPAFDFATSRLARVCVSPTATYHLAASISSTALPAVLPCSTTTATDVRTSFSPTAQQLPLCKRHHRSTGTGCIATMAACVSPM